MRQHHLNRFTSRAAYTHRVRHAIFWLDLLDIAGLTPQFDDALLIAYTDERQRRNLATIGDKLRAGTLGHRVSELPGETEQVCRQLAEDYYCGAYSTSAIYTLKTYAEQTATILKRRTLDSVVFAT